MDQPRIGIIAGIETTYEAAVRASGAEGGCAWVARVRNYDEGIAVARQMALKSVRVIITRAGYSVRLREANLSVPVIDIPFTSASLLELMLRAKKQYGTYAFIGNAAAVEAARSLESAAGGGARYYEVRSVDDFASAAVRVQRDGLPAAVGGYDETRFLDRLGIPAFVVPSHEDDITAAIREARKMLDQLDVEARRNQQLRTLLDMLPEGLVMVDAGGLITHINLNGRRLLGMAEGRAEGRRIPSPAIGEGVTATLSSKKTVSYDLLELKRAKCACTISPVVIGDRVSGAIVLLQEVEYVRSVEQRIRTQLSQRGLVAGYTFDDILGESEALRQALRRAKQYAEVDSTVLINGESGTGKEMFAQSIHNGSARRDGPFVAVNCATIPPNLLESELFGYAEGAFTGAKKSGKIGLFELAHRGTIFLDEIGESDVRMQARLLRVLEERQIMRVGDDRMIPVDVRVIAATNKDLAKLMAAGEFRQDFFYRLNVLTLTLPPLRERRDDLPLLIECFMRRYAQSYGRERVTVTPDGMRALMEYDWPGNARELKNAVERLIVTRAGQSVDRGGIAELLGFPSAPAPAEPPEEQTEEDWTSRLRETLERTGGNKTEAARLLGVSRPTLYRRLRALGWEDGGDT